MVPEQAERSRNFSAPVNIVLSNQFMQWNKSQKLMHKNLDCTSLVQIVVEGIFQTVEDYFACYVFLHCLRTCKFEAFIVINWYCITSK